MNVLFFGTAEFGVPVLQALFASVHSPVGAVANPDRPSGRGLKLTPPPVKLEALRMGIPVFQPECLDDAFFEKMQEISPDIALVAAYGKLLKKRFIDLPASGFINVHPSLLPLYRGPSPVHQPLLRGDSETGVTIIQLTEEMDAGPVILQETVSISDNDNAGSLHNRLAELGGILAVRALDLIEKGKAEFIEQDHSQAVYCEKITKEDALINWDRPADEIIRLVRGMTPYPGAYTFSGKDGTRIKVNEAEKESSDTSGMKPGTVVNASDKKGVSVAAKDGTVHIVRLAPAGGRRMTSREFVMGASIEKGDRFVSDPGIAESI